MKGMLFYSHAGRGVCEREREFVILFAPASPCTLLSPFHEGLLIPRSTFGMSPRGEEREKRSVVWVELHPCSIGSGHREAEFMMA